LKNKLSRVEPELLALQQTAEQLFINVAAIEKDGSFRTVVDSSESVFTTPESSQILDRISVVNHHLKSLIRVCEAYVTHLSKALHQNLEGVREESTALVVSFTEQVKFIIFAVINVISTFLLCNASFFNEFHPICKCWGQFEIANLSPISVV